MGWRYYARRAVGGTWLDTNVKVVDVRYTETLNGPFVSELTVLPAGPGDTMVAPDGRPIYGKWDTLVYIEIDDVLQGVFIVDDLYPVAEGTRLELIGLSAWLYGADYTDVFSSWEVNTFVVLRHLLDHATSKPRGIDFVRDGGLMSSTTVGDPNPPPKPKRPPRNKGESKKDWKGSQRYKDWENDLASWKNQYGDWQRYKIASWQQLSVGHEISELVKETGFQWCESYRWVDKAALTPEYKFLYADRLGVDRTDIEFVVGVNIAKELEPRDVNERYSNKVIALGAGEGPKMLRRTAVVDDGRLYKASFMRRKHVHNKKKLQRLADRQVARTAVVNIKIGAADVISSPGYASLNTLKLGDIVPVRSSVTIPPLDIMCKVISISRAPDSGVFALGLSTQ